MEYETFNMENVNYLKMIKFLKARFWLQECLELITCLMEKKKKDNLQRIWGFSEVLHHTGSLLKLHI